MANLEEFNKKTESKEQETFNLSKDNIIELPKDTILDGVITKIEKSTWRTKLENDESKIFKFEGRGTNVDRDMIFFTYECMDGMVKGEGSFEYFESPIETALQARMIKKYGEIKVGTKIRVQFDENGKDKPVYPKLGK